MKKYVKLEDVKALLNKLNNEPAYQHEDEDFYSGVCAVDCELSTLAIVEVADHTVHGKWIGKKYDWDNDYNPPEIKDSHYLTCSNCEHRHPLYNYNVWTNTLTRCTVFSDELKIPNYCPHCGAKMDGGN